MKCPHCLVTVHSEFKYKRIDGDKDGDKYLHYFICPSCSKMVISIGNYHYLDGSEILVYPRTHSRNPPSDHVPEKYKEDYNEACIVLADSAKASAALSRRCLQTLIRDEMSITKNTLSEEIGELLKQNKLPSHLADAIDGVRNIGNFATHPIKSKSSGEIVPVEPQEAEWNLEVLEGLFDFLFVQPAKLKEKKDALNAKLQEVGKPLME